MDFIRANDFPDAYFLFTKDISSWNNYFPVSSYYTHSISSKTNNDQDRLSRLILYFNRDVKYNFGFCL